MEYIRCNEENLEKFFEEQQIEDDDLFEFLKGREAILEMDTNKESKDHNMELTIKLLLGDL